MGLDQDHEQWVLTPDTTTLGPDARPKAKAFSRGSSDPLAWVCSHVCGSGLSAQDSPRPARLGQQPCVWVWPRRPGQPQHHVSANYGLQPHLAGGHLGLAYPSARCLQSRACNPTKTEPDHFLPNHPFKTILMRISPTRSVIMPTTHWRCQLGQSQELGQRRLKKY
jgi:hypothetical protein